MLSFKNLENLKNDQNKQYNKFNFCKKNFFNDLKLYEKNIQFFK